MSLIDEALKRARLDAARQDAARQTLTEAPRAGGFATPWTHMPESRRRGGAGRRNVVLVGVAAASLLIGATGIVLYLRGPRPGGPAAVVAPNERVPIAAPAPAQVVAPRSAPADPVAETKERGARSRDRRAEPSAERSREEDREVPASAVRMQAIRQAVAEDEAAHQRDARAADSPAAAPPAVAPPAPTNPTTPSVPVAPPSGKVAVSGGSYVGDVTLADGSLIKLSGIAFSESPVAVINGKVLGPGQGVDAVTVERIEADRVSLRDRSGLQFYLRLK